MSDEDTSEDERHVVLQGDCMSSLAQAYGLKWQTLWDHNPELKTLRKNPNALQPGDVVLIPSVRLRYEERPTDQQHKFIRRSILAKFRLVLERFDEPLAHKRWVLSVDGKDGRRYSGTTDSKGFFEIALPPQARSARLVVPEEGLEYELSFGHLDPLNSISGAQSRLQNLGFHQGAITGEMDDDTRDAILMFQTARGIPATGELDERTRMEIEQRHDNLHPQAAQESNTPPGETSGEDDQPEEVEINHDEDDRRFQQLASVDEEEE